MSSVGNVGEGAVSIVMEEDVAVDSGHINIGPAVVIEVGGCCTDAVSQASHSSFVGYIRERSIVIVAIQAVVETVFILGETGILGEAGQTCSVGKVNIEIAVIVVVEERDAPQDAIDDGFIFCSAVLQHKFRACLHTAIFETYP